MPTLKQLICRVELGQKNVQLREYGTEYGDGFVSSYIAVPEPSQKFSVHLTSTGYIAPGLAMFVFIDGVPQCNRNRCGLVIPQAKTPKDQYEIDFRVRQKEQKVGSRIFIGREWAFEDLQTTTSDPSPKISDGIKDGFGSIEIIVLRCSDNHAGRQTSTRSDIDDRYAKTLDGTNDQEENIIGTELVFQPDSSLDDGQSSPPISIDGADDNDGVPGFQNPNGRVNFDDDRLPRHDSTNYLNVPYSRENRRANISRPSRLRYSGEFRAAASDTGYKGSPGYGPARSPGLGRDPLWAGSGYSPYAAGYGAASFGPHDQAYGAHPFTYGYHSHTAGPGYNDPIQEAYAQGLSDARRDPKQKHTRNQSKETHGSESGADSLLEHCQKERKRSKSPTKTGDKQESDKGNDYGNNPNDDNNQSGGWGNSNDNNQNDAQNDNNQSGDWQASNDNNDQNNTWDKPNEDTQGNNWGNSNNDNQNNNGWNNTGGTENNWDTKDVTGDSNKHQKSKTKGRSGSRSKSSKRSETREKSNSKASDNHKPHVKAYWSKWGQSSAHDGKDTNDVYIIAEEPLLSVPKELIGKDGVKHQVRAGKGKLYEHPVGTPRYIDDMSDPYAVFIFKYRSSETLKKKFGEEAVKKDRQPFLERLKDLSRDELIERMLMYKEEAGIGSDSGFTIEDDTSASDNEEKSSKSHKSKSQTSKSKDNKSEKRARGRSSPRGGFDKDKAATGRGDRGGAVWKATTPTKGGGGPGESWNAAPSAPAGGW